MRVLFLAAAAAAALALAACDRSDGCRRLSDGAAVDRVIARYDRTPATGRGDPIEMQFTRARVVGVGRGAEPKGRGADGGESLIQVWFREDDHTLTAATLMQDCQVDFRPGLDPAAIKEAVYPAGPPRF